MFGGRVFQQTVGIPMGANCAPLLATCSFIRMRQISYKGFSRKRKEMLSIKTSSMFDEINFRELFGRISGFLQNKICPFLAQGICIYVFRSFL
jgi:hypothetical protein